MTELKQTPLYQVHLAAGAKMVDFGGWNMPVQYAGIIEEHKRVRESAGLFDVSHMGEFEVKGKDAKAFLQKILTNDLDKTKPGKTLYSPMCYEDGGTVDDLLIYCFSEEHYWLVVNASNIDKDWQWINSKMEGDVTLTDISDSIALLALQGPKAQSILALLTDLNLNELKSFRFIEGQVEGVDCVISRTGYTGEDGFEIYLPPTEVTKIWETLLEKGKPFGLAPIGLGARDTLRLEAKLPLYGHELGKDITPLEAGLGFFVKINTDKDFIGRAALAKQKEEGVPRKIVGLEMIDRGIPREGYKVAIGEEEIGYITSGTASPSLGKNIGLALISADKAQIGDEINVIIRNKPAKAMIIKTPFYKREEK